MMQIDLFNQDDTQLYTFSDMVWMLGYSYNELGLHRQALYYLSAFQDSGSLKQRREFILALVAVRDYRAYKTICDQLADAENWLAQYAEHEDYDAVLDYYEHTLLRSFVQVCTERGVLSEAEIALWMLNENEEDQDFVKEYTERIRKLREEENNN